jgi:hypothetical protein
MHRDFVDMSTRVFGTLLNDVGRPPSPSALADAIAEVLCI